MFAPPAAELSSPTLVHLEPLIRGLTALLDGDAAVAELDPAAETDALAAAHTSPPGLTPSEPPAAAALSPPAAAFAIQCRQLKGS